MPYSKAHKFRTRERILESARRLFNRHGFGGVSIDEIMTEADLTRGGFYNHFSSKEELYVAVVNEEAERWISGERIDSAAVTNLITAYLSKAHFDDLYNSCPLMAFTSDVARGPEAVKGAYRRVFNVMVGVLQQGLQGEFERQERALALAALCIGGMAVARAVDDMTLASEIRKAAKDLALSVASQPRPRLHAAE